MLNIGGAELFVLLVVALLVAGPKRLPEIARTVGKAMRAFQAESRRATELIKAEFEETTTLPGVIDTPDKTEQVAAAAAEHPAPPAEPVAPELRALEDT